MKHWRCIVIGPFPLVPQPFDMSEGVFLAFAFMQIGVGLILALSGFIVAEAGSPFIIEPIDYDKRNPRLEYRTGYTGISIIISSLVFGAWVTVVLAATGVLLLIYYLVSRFPRMFS